MKNKIIALLMVIPLLFMFTLFSFVESASITIPVYASSIVVDNKPQSGNVYLEVGGAPFVVEATVFPTEADDVTYTVSANITSGSAECIRVIDNKIFADDVGKADIEVSTSNGYKDRFSVVSSADKAISFVAMFKDAEGNVVDMSKELDVGEYSIVSVIHPANVYSDISYVSNNNAVVSIAGDGTVKLLRPGSAIITATLVDGIDGMIVNQYTINVAPVQSTSGVIVDGNTQKLDIAVPATGTDVSIDATMSIANSLAGDVQLSVGGVLLPSDCYRVTPITVVTASNSYQGYRDYNIEVFAHKVIEHCGKDVVVIDVEVGGMETGFVINVEIADLQFDIATTMTYEYKAYWLSVGDTSTVNLSFDDNMSGDGHTYVWSVEGSGIDIVGNAESATLRAQEVGSSVITVTAFAGDEQVHSDSMVINVNDIDTIEFTDMYKANGISTIYAIGDKAMQGGVVKDQHNALSLELNGSIAEEFGKYESMLSAYTSDTNVATVTMIDGELVLDIVGEGSVDIVVYCGRVDARVKLYAVDDGVHVSDSVSLFGATKAKHKVILDSDIELGDHMTLEQRKQYLRDNTFVSTYNTQYLDNKDMDKTLSYVIDIANDIHGNGHTLLAELFANTPSEDYYTGQTGALNYISAEFLGGGIQVLGQDNVMFLMRTDGVLVDNVVLSGRHYDKLLIDNQVELTQLDYTGTVLDINASVTVSNSEICRGKNVVRVYGGNKSGDDYFNHYKALAYVGSEKVPTGIPIMPALDTSDKIEVDLYSCRIHTGREFVVKVGANKAVQAIDNAEVIPGKSILDFEVNIPLYPPIMANGDYQYDSTLEPSQVPADMQQYFEDNYVATVVNIVDCLLYDSGLMVVGVESAFNGMPLTNKTLSDIVEQEFVKQIGDSSTFALDWVGIGATSYASIVNLVGSTNMFGWKNLDTIDTTSMLRTTLINDSMPLPPGFSMDSINGLLQMFALNIPSMVEGYVAKYPDNADIVTNVGKDEPIYDIFAGICMYGGGINYSQVNFVVESESPLSMMKRYDINLDDADDLLYRMLAIAAGTEDFRFYMHSSDSSFDKATEILARSNSSIIATPLH